jgi:tRNA(fMet)-specific endonuclease VapC
MMYILDTNILSELIKANPRIVQRFEVVPETDEVTTTTISRYELLRGRYSSILTAADKPQLLLAQRRLQEDEEQLSEIRILLLTEEAADHFERLYTSKKFKKIGRPDLLIACIALAYRATLVTRNIKDFIAIPTLKLENWAD